MSRIFKIIEFQKRRSCLNGDDDGDYDYAPATCLEGGGDGDDGDYDYAPATSLQGDDDDRDYRVSSIFMIIGSHKRKSYSMLLKFFRNVIRRVSDSSKIMYFRRIQHGCGIIFGNSEEYRSCSYDDTHDYALITCLEGGGDDDDDNYDYAPTTSLKQNNDDAGRDYDYTPPTSLKGDDNDGDNDYALAAFT